MRCAGCGADVPDERGPTHRYLESAPGCWRIYGELLAREYADPAYYECHALSVDAYAVQHPGRPSRQTIASATLHLARLYAVIERGLPPPSAAAFMKRIADADKTALRWLDPPERRGDVTVVDAAAAADAAAHCRIVWRWAESAWNAWSPHHAAIAAWAAPYFTT